MVVDGLDLDAFDGYRIDGDRVYLFNTVNRVDMTIPRRGRTKLHI